MSAPDPAPPQDEVPEALEEEIEAIGEDYLESLRRREAPASSPIVEAHPELAPWLERRLRLLEWMHGLASSVEGPGDPGEPIPIRCPKCRQAIRRPISGPGKMTCEHCGSGFRIEGEPAAVPPADGLPRRIDRFLVTEVLGQGSFGIVYKAIDEDLGRTVTLKVPRAGFFRTPDEARRFAREARSAAGLRHPGIVQVHEIAEAGGMPYIVREYIEGRTLEEVLRGGRPSFRRSARIIEDMADALDHAHRHGIVHRDIKPENIVIDGSGQAFVTDFGLARKDEGEETITLDGQVLGTPAYMSPEQAAGRQDRVDGRSDVYGLGVVLYELLTGERPFTGTRNMVLHQVLHEEPRPPRRLNDRIPRDLETICVVAMQKEPERRYATAGDLRDDLRRFLSGDPIRARPVGRAEVAWRWCRRNPAIAVLTAALVLLAAAVTVGSIAAAVRFREKEGEARSAGGRAEAALDESRRQLVRLNVSTGTRIFDAGDPFGALPYLAEALRNESGGSEAHRVRLRAAVDRCPRLLRVWRHRGSVIRLGFSPDGRLAFFSIDDLMGGPGRVSVHAIDSGEPRGEPILLSAPAVSAGFSPDGKRLLAAALDGSIRIRDLATGGVLKLSHGGGCAGAAFGPDGSLLLSVGPDGAARVWRADSGEPTAVLLHEQGVEEGCFSPDGRRIATVSGDAAFVWDLEKKERLATIRHDPIEKVLNLRFSPDGRRLAGGSLSGNCRLWDAATGWPAGEVMVHGKGVNMVAFSPDGKRLATSSWDRGRIWDAVTGAPLTRPMQEQCDQVFAAFSPDGRHVVTTSGFQRNACLWDAHTGEPAFQPLRHGRIVRGAAFHPEGHLLLTASDDGLARLWDLTRGQPAAPPIEGTGFFEGAGISSDGRWLAIAGADRSALIFSMDDGTLAARLDHPSRVRGVAFRPGRPQALAQCSDGRIVLWDVESGAPIWSTPAAPKGTAWRAAFDPTGEHLVTSDSRGSLVLRDPATGEARGEPAAQGAEPMTLAFSRDGSRLCLGWPTGELRLLGLPGWKEIWRRSDPVGAIRTASFDGPGDRLATGHGDGSAWIRDAASGACRVEIGDPRHLDRERGRKIPHSSGVETVEFSPDGLSILAASPDGDARIWSAATGEGESRWLRHGSIQSAAFSPDGRWALTASQDGSGRIWDWRTGEVVTPPLVHGGEVPWFRLGPRGDRAVTAGADGSMRIWDIRRDDRPIEDLVLLARILSGSRIGNGTPEILSPEEVDEGWRTLRARWPEEFAVPAGSVRDWHRREAAIAEKGRDWPGVLWHADRLLGDGSSGLPRLERLGILRRRGTARAELGQREGAAGDFRRLFEVDPGDYRSGYALALLSLALGDGKGHREACARLLASAGQGSDTFKALTVRACILGRGGGADAEEVVRLARKVLSFGHVGALGAAVYRAGRSGEAILQLNKARLYYPGQRVHLLGGMPLDFLFLAMAYHDGGFGPMAAQALEKAEGQIAGELASGTSLLGHPLEWHDRLWRELLLREARAHVRK